MTSLCDFLVKIYVYKKYTFFPTIISLMKTYNDTRFFSYLAVRFTWESSYGGAHNNISGKVEHPQ